MLCVLLRPSIVHIEDSSKGLPILPILSYLSYLTYLPYQICLSLLMSAKSRKKKFFAPCLINLAITLRCKSVYIPEVVILLFVIHYFRDENTSAPMCNNRPLKHS